ncbi:hypothetical protein [Streptomyces sp. 2323.1]|uniref:hypothetical protein n=1 Tax=Streptomyces sp. 2323.1 TaxID=1938841 RepID=UPI0013316B26|nr:hypothetical protein [Streptomyces sp. 2323.1]
MDTDRLQLHVTDSNGASVDNLSQKQLVGLVLGLSEGQSFEVATSGPKPDSRWGAQVVAQPDGSYRVIFWEDSRDVRRVAEETDAQNVALAIAVWESASRLTARY